MNSRTGDVYRLAVDRLHAKVKRLGETGDPVLTVADDYPGVWLEASPYDGLQYARHAGGDPAVAIANVEVFLNHQREDGQFPCYILDSAHPNMQEWIKSIGSPAGFTQMQELVPLAWVIYEVAKLTGNEMLLARGYTACCRWDDWIVRHRMTRGSGVVEMFCEFDMGMDFCPRATDGGIPHCCPENDARNCPKVDCLPLLAPDQSAVVYGSRMALAEMAEALGKSAEARVWRQKAQDLKHAIHKHCFDAADEFFYDVDRAGQMRKYRTCHITFLLSEGVVDQPLFDRIYTRYLRNPNEFWTVYPFPSVSISDPSFQHDFPHPNSWGCWTNSPLLYRLSRWMDRYGKTDDLMQIMQKWVDVTLDEPDPLFRQGVNPTTGQWSAAGIFHSDSLLFFIEAANRLNIR